MTITLGVVLWSTVAVIGVVGTVVDIRKRAKKRKNLEQTIANYKTELLILNAEERGVQYTCQLLDDQLASDSIGSIRKSIFERMEQHRNWCSRMIKELEGEIANLK